MVAGMKFEENGKLYLFWIVKGIWIYEEIIYITSHGIRRKLQM